MFHTVSCPARISTEGSARRCFAWVQNKSAMALDFDNYVQSLTTWRLEAKLTISLPSLFASLEHHSLGTCRFSSAFLSVIHLDRANAKESCRNNANVV